MIVVMRDPRNVVVSEHKMRIETYHQKLPPLNKYIHERMEVGTMRRARQMRKPVLCVCTRHIRE